MYNLKKTFFNQMLKIHKLMVEPVELNKFLRENSPIKESERKYKWDI